MNENVGNLNNFGDNPKKPKNNILIIGIFCVVLIAIIIVCIVFFSGKSSNSKWTIDKGNESNCAQAVQTIYEDDKYKYTVSNGCVASYKIVYSDDESYTINEALVAGKITVDDLISEGVEISKESKDTSWGIDKGSDDDVCAQAIVPIYEDDNYYYSVPDSCVANYKVVYSNGESYSLRDALTKGKVTIDDLINKGVNIIKESKKVTWSIDKSSDSGSCTQAVVPIYEDANYYYNVPNGCVAAYEVVYSNGQRYTLHDALKAGKVTIDELISKGVSITKESKKVTWSIDKGTDDMCAAVIVSIYEDANYYYNVPNACVAAYEVVYSNGQRYTLHDALKAGKVTIDELISKGVSITKEPKKLTWTIDKGTDDVCAAVIVTIHEDANYKYTVPNACVADYKVVFSNGQRYSLNDALGGGKVTVDELISKGVSITKEPKQLTWSLDKGSEDDMCAAMLVTIYEDANYTYSVPNSCVADYKVVFSNGERYSLHDALANNKVTVDELMNKGVTIYKDHK